MLTRRALANAIRALSMDAVQQANSGHPGAPMGMADIAEVLWNDFLRHNPANPAWVNRDRFILSNGHASMLLYALLHLSGYDLSMDELRQFRQLGSKTPGHPEYGHTPGVETTTGPLGQGLANAVGMAIAERSLASEFNRDDFAIVDHYTYVLVGDGCLMEGISHEACSLAGTLGLGKLIVIYDNNDISIDGPVQGWFTENIQQRFNSYGWQVIPAVDGHDPEAVHAAIEQARAETNKPSLIDCKTTIGWGAPQKQGTAACHGAPLGAAEVAAARQALGWEYPPFAIPADYYQAWSALERGAEAEQQWQSTLEAYQVAYPELAAELKRRLNSELPAAWNATMDKHCLTMAAGTAAIATRASSKAALEACGQLLPELIGGSADLSDSNKTLWSGCRPLNTAEPSGNYIYYGVREFAMAAVMNGLNLHGGFIAYGGTFLIFSDYARNALRMAALMRVGSIFVFSHDSIGVGEDGPTHQPIEQLAGLRHIPNMQVWRPCDAVETSIAWRCAIERRDGPSAIVTSRQNVPPPSARTADQITQIRCGGYILLEPDGEPEGILIATGSEVGLALQAAQQLSAQGRRLRVVSMPSTTLFDAQDANYKESVLPSPLTKRAAIEAGISGYWRKYVGLAGTVIGIDSFGVSAPASDVFEHFGLTVDNIVRIVNQMLD